MRGLRIRVFGILTLALGGCAAIENGGTDEVGVVSDPSGSTVTTSVGVTSDGPSCRSPCKVYVDRKEAFTVTVAKAGFATQAVEVKSRAGTAQEARTSFLDDNAGGILVDNLTSATFIHVPDPVVVKLVPVH